MPKILEQDSKKLLANVPEEYVFRCCDGRILKNMLGLGEAFIRMKNETFSYHSNGERSDFADWVRDIIGDGKLARDIERSPNKTRAANSVIARIAFLHSKLS